jgi:ribokinase
MTNAPPKTPEIVVIGSANIDLVMQIHRVPNAGETLTGGKFTVSSGGKGANQAVALARLGARVKFVGRLGEDPFGDILVRSMANSGVDVSGVIRDPINHTGTVMIIVDANGDNAMITDYGSNLCFCSEDLEVVVPHLRGADLMLLQCEVSEALNLHAVSIGQGIGIPVIINPASNIPTSIEMLKGAALITPNLAEVKALASLCEGSLSFGSSPIEQALQASRILIREGVPRIVVTLGHHGALYISAEEQKIIGTFPTTQVDATGAGDAFTAALSYGLAAKLPVSDCMELAAATAAIAVSRLGAQPSFPTMGEVKKFLESKTLRPAIEC